MPLFAAGLFALDLFAERLFSDTDAPVVVPDEPAQTPAGRKRRKYVVEVDGQEFTFDSLDQALSLLSKAEALAQKAAESKAEALISADLPKAYRVGKARPVSLKPPTIKGPIELRPEIARTKERVRQIYRDAALAAELRILMALEAERDDEEALLLSL